MNFNIDSDEERTDVLERSEWLATKVLVAPEELIDEMPSFLGKHFMGEWAIYSCSFYAAALANICRQYPEQKGICLERMERIINIVNTPQLREYDTSSFQEDAMQTLDGPNSHMTYLSILAWVISLFRLAGGHDAYDSTLFACCEALSRRMQARRDLCLPSFPNGIVFIPDMLVTIVALHNCSILYDGMYHELVDRWLHEVKTNWLDPETGLIVATRYSGCAPAVRGSYAALTCFYLSLIDEGFARQQYEKMVYFMRLNTVFKGVKVSGIREYMHSAPSMAFDPDSGPIVEGLSASGTAWALGSATRFGDTEFRHQILRIAELAGVTAKGHGMRHYRLGNLVLVGEAVALAMRTNY